LRSLKLDLETSLLKPTHPPLSEIHSYLSIRSKTANFSQKFAEPETVVRTDVPVSTLPAEDVHDRLLPEALLPLYMPALCSRDGVRVDNR